MGHITFNSGNNSVSLSPGSSILIHCNRQFLEELIPFANPGSLVNCYLPESKKVPAYSDQLRVEQVFDVLDEIHRLTGFRIGSYDYVDKLLVCAIVELRQHDLIFVELAGLTGASISLAIDIFNVYLRRHNTKMIVMFHVDDKYQTEHIELIEDRPIGI